MKKVIATTKAPGAIGPYSQAIEANGMVFISGQLPINPATGEMPEGVTAQTEQSLKNLEAILNEAGCTFEEGFGRNRNDCRKMKIVFLEPLGLKVSQIEAACEGLKKAGHEVVVYPDRNENLDELKHRAEGADVIIESNIPLRKDFLDACPNLKMLSIAFTGLDHIDMEECQRRGIIVKNAAGYSTEAVAELAVAMMIDVYRKVLENDVITRQCNRKGIMPGREIGGKTLGIIGMGNIGQRVAKLANAFGCKVLAWNRTSKQVEGVTFVDKETLLKESDIVTLHIALNAETRDFLTEKEFALMKPSSILINTARGPVVNEQALANALKQGKIAGAATDVYGMEPPLKPENPLFDAPNLVMLPHIGFATEEAFVLRLGIVVDNVMRWINEE